MGKPKAPEAPKPAKDYEKFIKLQLKYLPQQLQAELGARQEYDPKFIAEQLATQKEFAPEYYGQQLEALKTLDPTGQALREQLGKAVSSDLSAGYGLGGLEQTAVAAARGRQAATGASELGNAADINEVLGTTAFAQQLRQQRVAEAGRFLGLPTPEQQLLSVSPVAANAAGRYVNYGAGLQGIQAGQGNYQNMLAQYQASGGGTSPWASSLSGAIGGATAGASFGPYGAAGGAILGGVGGYFSDARKKNHVEYIGRSAGGNPIYEFEYDDIPNKRFRGTIAQELLKTAPDACSLGEDGFWRVDYDKIDIKLEEVEYAGVMD